MNMEWINVADTAVKIGLGGIISGVFTYLGLKYSHKSQLNKHLFEHKIKLVEQITADIDEYFAGISSLISRIGGIAKTRKIKENENIPLSDAQWESIRSRDDLLVSSWPKRRYAIAKLRLLKANDVVEKLSECAYIEDDLRNKIMFSHEMYTYDEIIDLREKLRVATVEVHSALSDLYDSLLK